MWMLDLRDANYGLFNARTFSRIISYSLRLCDTYLNHYISLSTNSFVILTDFCVLPVTVSVKTETTLFNDMSFGKENIHHLEVYFLFSN